MTTVTGISSQPKQQLTLVLEDGSQVSVYLEYRPQQLGWFANFSWGDWIVNGLRLVSTPNLLHSWFKLIPFGLAITTAQEADPLNPTSFASGLSTMVVLNAAEVRLVNATSYVGF